MTRSLPNERFDLSLRKLVAELRLDAQIYLKYRKVYTDGYLRLLLAQKEQGQVRRFERTLALVTRAMATLEAYNLDEFLRQVPMVLVDRPVVYQAGSDDCGRPVVVLDWNRIDLARSSIQDVVKIVVLSFKSFLEQTKANQLLVLMYAQGVKVTKKQLPRATRLVQALAKALIRAFPDVDVGTYYFVPSYLAELARYGRSLVPDSSMHRHIIAENHVLRKELELRCSNVNEILPPELGGNEVSLERNVCWMVTQDCQVVSKVLDRENSSSRNIVIVNDDPPQAALGYHVPKLVSLGA